MQQGHKNTRTAGADRVSKGDCPAVDVHLLRIETQRLTHGKELCGKRFVGFDQIDIRKCQVNLFGLPIKVKAILDAEREGK